MKRQPLLFLFAMVPWTLGAREHPSVAASFLTLPVGARSAAMGDAGAALAQDAATLFWNPAGLVRAPQTSLAIGRVPYADRAAQDHLVLSRGIGSGVFASGIETFSHGFVDTADLDGLPTGSLSPTDRQIALGYARHFPGVPFLAGHAWGFAAKQVASTLSGSAQTYALDVGLLSPPLRNGQVAWGMSVANLGGTLKYHQDKELLPRVARVGAVWRPEEGWTAAVDAVKIDNDKLCFASGLEYARAMAGPWTVAARAGYTTAEDSLNGLRFGFGVGWRNLRINYFYRFGEDHFAAQGLDITLSWAERGRGLPPALQALVDRGNRLIETRQYPEAVLKFHEALIINSTCQEARDGLERAYRLMQGR